MSGYFDRTGLVGAGGAAFLVAFLMNGFAAAMFFWVLTETGVAKTVGWSAVGSLLFAFGPAMVPAILSLGPLLAAAYVPRWLRWFTFIGAGWSLTLILATMLGGAGA